MARDRIKELRPDVLTLDVEMPRMDGLTFLRNLMRLRPMPVVMLSSLTERGAETTLAALEIGAVDFVAKPKIDLAHSLDACRDEIAAKVIAAFEAGRLLDRTPATSAAPRTAPAPSGGGRHFHTSDRIVAIGPSTGGTEAIRARDQRAAADAPGMVIVQHIPEMFSASFAKRLDRECALSVAEVRDGAQILSGHACVAPGNRHLSVARDGARFVCRLSDGPPVDHHRQGRRRRRGAVGDAACGRGDAGAGRGVERRMGHPGLGGASGRRGARHSARRHEKRSSA